MITRLRAAYSAQQLEEIYSRPYDHTKWEDHKIRVSATIHAARWLRDYAKVKTAADLSCGDGTILRELHLPRENCTYSDFVHVANHDLHGPIEHTIHQAPTADMLILSETLEHLNNPFEILTEARIKYRTLILTTPEGETGTNNPEHYWGWDRDDIRGMLDDAGFNPITSTILHTDVPGAYTYQIWGCT